MLGILKHGNIPLEPHGKCTFEVSWEPDSGNYAIYYLPNEYVPNTIRKCVVDSRMQVISNTSLPIPPGDAYIDSLQMSVVYSPDSRPLLLLPNLSTPKQMYYFNRFNSRCLKLGGFRSDIPLYGENRIPVVGSSYGVTMIDNNWTELRLFSFPWDGLKSTSRMSSVQIAFPEGTYAQGSSAICVPDTLDNSRGKMIWMGIRYKEPAKAHLASQIGLLVAEIPFAMQDGELIIDASEISWEQIDLPGDTVGNAPYCSARLYMTTSAEVDAVILYQGPQSGHSSIQFLRRQCCGAWGVPEQFDQEIMTGLAYGDINIVDAGSPAYRGAGIPNHPNRLLLASGRSASATKYSSLWYGIDGAPVGSDDIVTFANASVQTYQVFGTRKSRTVGDYVFAGDTWTGNAVVA